jgi:REP element-mobilizing transposase RayT
MNRGNHRQRIFGDDKDREMFLATLAETCQAAGWVVHSFVLMPTHYHLLIETMRAAVWSRARGKPTRRLAVRGAEARQWWQQMLLKLTAAPNCHAVERLQA